MSSFGCGFFFVQEQRVNDEVANTATFENIGYATLEGNRNPDKPYLLLLDLAKKLLILCL